MMVPDEDTQVPSVPLTIKAKFYPLIIVTVLNIVEFPRLDLPAGFLLGYVEYKFFNGVLLRPSYVILIHVIRAR